MLGISQELEVGLGLWINADAPRQGVTVERGACSLLPEIARDSGSQLLDRHGEPPKPEARCDRDACRWDEYIRLHTLDRCGHLPMLEQPAAINQVLAEFLRAALAAPRPLAEVV